VWRVRRKWLFGALGAYAVLWAATAVWGPAAMEAQQRARDDDYRAQQPYPDEPVRFRHVRVPAPFVVMAEWYCIGHPHSLMRYAKGDRWGVWLPGRLWVVRDWNKEIGCGGGVGLPP